MISHNRFQALFVVKINVMISKIVHTFSFMMVSASCTGKQIFTFTFNLYLFHRNGAYRSDCKIIGGSPNQSLEVSILIIKFLVPKIDYDHLQDCIFGDTTDGGCDDFLQQECEYEGQDTGLSPPPGQITNPTECQLYCRDNQV